LPGYYSWKEVNGNIHYIYFIEIINHEGSVIMAICMEEISSMPLLRERIYHDNILISFNFLQHPHSSEVLYDYAFLFS